MWAGGVISWFPDVPKLVIGQDIIQTLKVKSVELKVGMVFVNQVRELRAAGSSEVAVEELRTYVFRQSEPSKKSSKVKVVWSPPASPDFSSIIMPTSPLLFRFSALTFNGHKIHYDQVFARESEGHREHSLALHVDYCTLISRAESLADVVVHGPLTALLLIENTVDFLTKTGGKRLIKFDYRAISPMYVDRMITFAGAWKDESMGQMDIWSCQDGKVTMRATGVVI
jgi:3-methylfumaryl-CoA hydratase